VGLLEAGAQGGKAKPSSRQPANSGKDVLNNLLQNALKQKQPSGH
jgi:hypothetical protein